MAIKKPKAPHNRGAEVTGATPGGVAGLDFHLFIWIGAIRAWQDGDVSAVQALLLKGEPIPMSARRWLADLAAGKAKRRRGNPGFRPSQRSLAMQFARDYRVRERYQVLLPLYQAIARIQTASGTRARDGKPSERAAEFVGAEFGIDARTVHRIIERWEHPGPI